MNAWTDPARSYHNAGHLAALIEALDGARDLADHPDEVEAALWFHDAVYQPGARDNEAHSAAWAFAALTGMGVPAAATARIRGLVLDTRHENPPSTNDGRLIADLDLAILGSDPGTYDAYRAAIRREYGALGDEEWRAGRRAVLEGLLGRDRIYSTDHFCETLEWSARENLQRELATLE